MSFEPMSFEPMDFEPMDKEPPKVGIPTLDRTHPTQKAIHHRASEVEVTFTLFVPGYVCYQCAVSTCSYSAVSGDPDTN